MADQTLLELEPLVKRCPRCREAKPFSAFPRNPSRKHGIHSYCNECANAIGRKRTRLLREKKDRQRDEGAPIFKCTGCGVTKPITKFRYDARKPRGHDTKCKECLNRNAERRHAENLRRRDEAILAGEKRICGICGQPKLIKEFRSERRNKDGCSSRCIQCLGLYLKEYWRRRRSGENTSARTELRKTFGLLKSEYDALLDKQGDKCAICATPFERIVPNKKVNIDHDHASGAVRGLLCITCNVGLGGFKDSISLLASAARYLTQHRSGR